MRRAWSAVTDPDSPRLLRRLEGGFLCATVAAGLVVALLIVTGGAAERAKAVGLLGLGLALGSWWRLRRRRRVPVQQYAIEAVALTAVGVGVGEPSLALGLMYLALHYRALVDSPWGTAATAVTFLGAHVGAVHIAGGLGTAAVPATDPAVLQQVMGFGFAGLVMQVLVRTAWGQQRDADRQQAVARTTAAFGRASSEAELADLVVAGARGLAGIDGREAVVALGPGALGGLRVLPMATATCPEGSLDPGLDAAALVAGRAQAIRCARSCAADSDAPTCTAAGVVVDGRLDGLVAIRGAGDRDLPALQTLAADAGLALDRLRSAARTEASEARFRALIANASDCLRILDSRGVITFESDAVRSVFGFEPGAVVGRQALELIHPGDHERMAAGLQEMLADPSVAHSVEFRAQHADGSWRAVEASVRDLRDHPDVGGIVVNYRDVSTRKELERRLVHAATHDQLTGLANRTRFYEVLDEALVEALVVRPGTVGSGSPAAVAILFVDLNGFKDVNDARGHVVGDRVLAATAERLREAVGPAGTVARLGGDEFAVLVTGPAAADAPRLARRLRTTLAAPIPLPDDCPAQVSASIGVAVRTDEPDAEALLSNADLAMYWAKEGDGGGVEVYDVSMREDQRAREALQVDIDRGLAAGEFVPAYQPIVDLASGALVGAEALVRWHHAARGELPPGVFLPLAEDTGQVVAIGRHVLASACADAARWPLPLPVNVNLCAAELLDDGLVGHVRAVLAAAGLPADRLVVEITETQVLHELDAVREVLEQLRALGVRVALDDFGTGYSSLTMLDRFPVSWIKIDRSFVSTLGTAAESPVAAATIALARAMGVSVTAEGVEEPRQARRLREAGCDSAQGHLFAMPLPGPAFADRLRAELRSAAAS